MAESGADSMVAQSTRSVPGSRAQQEIERDLVDRVVRNDPDAVRELFVDRYGRSLSFLARRLGLEDHTGVLFQYLSKNDWRRLRTWKGDSSLGTWLYTVASRFFRKIEKNPLAHRPQCEWRTHSAPDSDPLAEMIRQERKSELVRAVMALPNDESRKVIVLHYFKEMSLNEVAMKLNISTARLYVVKHRALLKLRGILDERASND